MENANVSCSLSHTFAKTFIELISVQDTTAANDKSMSNTGLDEKNGTAGDKTTPDKHGNAGASNVTENGDTHPNSVQDTTAANDKSISSAARGKKTGTAGDKATPDKHGNAGMSNVTENGDTHANADAANKHVAPVEVVSDTPAKSSNAGIPTVNGSTSASLDDESVVEDERAVDDERVVDEEHVVFYYKFPGTLWAECWVKKTALDLDAKTDVNVIVKIQNYYASDTRSGENKFRKDTRKLTGTCYDIYLH